MLAPAELGADGDGVAADGVIEPDLVEVEGEGGDAVGAVLLQTATRSRKIRFYIDVYESSTNRIVISDYRFLGSEAQ